MKKEENMKFVKYLTALFLIIVLFDTAAASSVKITNAGSTTIQSPFTTMPPTIDGILSTNEWNNAAVRTFTLSYPNESYPATLYVMNDGFNLYFAMTITDNDYHYGDHIAIGFNNEYDFLYIQANGESYDGHQNSSGYITFDTEQGGSNDIVAKAAVNILTNNNVNYVFEISHPFNSVDDSNDISLYLGDSVNISVLYLDMNRGFTSTNSWTSVLILGSGTSTPTPTITSIPISESEVHVHKVNKLSLNNLSLYHNQLYDFDTLWTPNVWNVKNLSYVIYKISTPLNFTKVENYEEYQNGSEVSSSLPYAHTGNDYIWNLSLVDRIGSNIDLYTNETNHTNPWADLAINKTQEGNNTRLNITFIPAISLGYNHLIIKAEQIVSYTYPGNVFSAVPGQHRIFFSSDTTNQNQAYNFSVLVNNPEKVNLWLDNTFDWVVDQPSNTISLPVSELGSINVSTSVPVKWSHRPVQPQYVQDITINMTASTPTATPTTIGKGDVNGDGQVTVVDALFVAQYTVGARTLTSSQLAAADVNGDGQVTIVDALFIAQYTVGLRQL